MKTAVGGALILIIFRINCAPSSRWAGTRNSSCGSIIPCCDMVRRYASNRSIWSPSSVSFAANAIRRWPSEIRCSTPSLLAVSGLVVGKRQAWMVEPIAEHDGWKTLIADHAGHVSVGGG